MSEFWAEQPKRKVREDANGGIGVRVYEGIYDTSGAVPGAAAGVRALGLPSRGDGYPGSSARLKLDMIDKQQVSTSSQWVATLTYMPETTGEWSTSGEAFADLPRSWSISGELLQFSYTGDYYYVNDPGANDPIVGETPAYKKIATGRLTIQEVITDIDAARTRAKLSLNTTNTGSFEGGSSGNMLYIGFEAEEFTNDDGDKRWRLRHQFLERDIPGKANKGWEYVLRDDTAEWSFIQISAAANDPLPIYPSSSFSQIFGTT